MNDATIAEELVEALESSPDIVSMTWDEDEYKTRIFPQIRVQDDRKQLEQLPAIIYDMRDQGAPIASEDDMSLRNQLWRVVCFSYRYQEMEQLAKAVITTLSAHVGPGIRELVVLGQDDDYEDELNVHERQIDLSIKAWS